MFENVQIRDMQTLCIDMADTYVTIVYAGTVDHIKRFIMSVISITEGGADLKSSLHTLDEIKERLQDLTLGRENQVVDKYLKFK
jgi:hypothetical protein